MKKKDLEWVTNPHETVIWEALKKNILDGKHGNVYLNI